MAFNPGAAPRDIRPSYAVVYDGDCKVCGKFARQLAKWDREGVLEIVPSQAPGVAARFSWITPSGFDESVQLIRLADGRTWQRAAALEELLTILPRGGAVSWLFKIPFVQVLADRYYRWFARNRYRFGCSDHCRVR